MWDNIIIIDKNFFEIITKIIIASCLGLMLACTKFQIKKDIIFKVRFFIIIRVILAYLLVISVNNKISIAIIALALLQREIFYKDKDLKRQDDNYSIYISSMAYIIGFLISSNYTFLAIIITILFVVIFYIINFYYQKFNLKYTYYQLQITIPENINYMTDFNELFDKYFNYVFLYSVKTINMGSLFELKYYVSEKTEINEKEMIDNFRVINSNLPIVIIKDIY